MNIIVMGPQGSGKSTQAKRLAEDLGLLYVSTGKIVRELAETEDPMGKEAERYVKRGELVPDDLINEILTSWVDFQKKENGFVFDGYPRRVSQIEVLENNILTGEKIDIVFYINIPKREILKRLTERAKTEHRLDETREAIAKRLEEYQENTIPILNCYRQRGLLYEINGLGSIEEIYERIRLCLTEKHLNR